MTQNKYEKYYAAEVEAPLVAVNARIAEDDVELLIAYGRGKATNGIRQLLDENRDRMIANLEARRASKKKIAKRG